MPSTERATAGSSAVERKRQAIADSMQAHNSRRMSGLLTMWQWLCYGAYIVSGLQLLANPLFGSVRVAVFSYSLLQYQPSS